MALLGYVYYHTINSYYDAIVMFLYRSIKAKKYWTHDILNKYMDAAAEIGRNPVSQAPQIDRAYLPHMGDFLALFGPFWFSSHKLGPRGQLG